MKLFGWMQNKLSGKQETNKKTKAVPASYPKKQVSREEFNDWPHGLLAIGTFGNNPEINIISKDNNDDDSEIQNIQEQQEETSSSSMDLQDFTPEEIGKLEKELTKLLRRKQNSDNKEKEIAISLPLDRFLNCPSSLEVDRRNSNAITCNEISDDHHHHHNQDLIKDEDIDRTISVILGRCKDIRADNKSKKAIGKKSISFLLKKMFVCRSGFGPQPSLRDTLQESRMERFLRVMLHKKMSAQQNASKAPSMKNNYLEDTKRVSNYKKATDEEDGKKKQEKNNNDGCKWVKTDSEYIVLEI